MRSWLLATLFLYSIHSPAQTIKGKLFGTQGATKEILPGAALHCLYADTVVYTNDNGVFELPALSGTDPKLVAAVPGYIADTIHLSGKSYLSIILKRNARELSAVVVRDQSGAYIAGTAIKTEVINRQELSKAACCDLAGCFGTQASVQPQTTNIVTNAQELRILGLSGVYNQVLFDGLPMIQALSYTYGISTYPGTIIDNIYVSKGTTSVLQGYESISGQINLESRNPAKTDKLHLNGYINSFGEKHLNANIALPLGKTKKWSSLLALHTVQPAARTDGNKDGFLDLPLLTRYMAYNKWKYGNDKNRGFHLQAGLRLTDEQRIGGQNNYRADTDAGSSLVYGQVVHYIQPEAYVKTGYRFSDNHALTLAVSGMYHDQQSWFGTTRYKATQSSGYINLQHEWRWQDRHQLKYGLSFRYQDLKEQVGFSEDTLRRSYAGNYRTRLQVPGMFAENTFHWLDDKIVWITGIRADRHQDYGWYVTPRTMLKYAAGKRHTLRASAGSGWRQVNLFSEQVMLLASSRDIIFAETLKPEQAFNWGLSDTWGFEKGNTSGTLSVDFYSTQFSNQFFPDYDSKPGSVIIRNFEGLSRSYGLQVDASLRFNKRLELRAAYNYLNVYRRENNIKVLLPFNARNRVMAAVSGHSRNKKWQADLNAHWFDRMRLPDTRSNPVPYQRGSYSSPYMTVNAQLTFRHKQLELYGGCENIAGYRQPNPIISADNPFSRYFDLSSVWGPTRGREFYMGIRYSIK